MPAIFLHPRLANAVNARQAFQGQHMATDHISQLLVGEQRDLYGTPSWSASVLRSVRNLAKTANCVSDNVSR